MSDKPSKDARWHNGRESRLMVECDGWCMVRRPGAAPYVMFAKDWHALPTAAEGRAMFEQYRAAIEEPRANP